MDDSTPRESLPIVVGVDGSAESVLALRWAKKLAGPLGATIKAISAWRLEVVFGPYAVSDWDSESVAQQQLAHALVDAFGDDQPGGLISECHRGQPAQVLIEEGKNAQMLIVGSRGHGGFKGMLLGSVSSACAAHASCPVLVVHPDNAADSVQKTTGTGTLQRAVDETAGDV